MAKFFSANSKMNSIAKAAHEIVHGEREPKEGSNVIVSKSKNGDLTMLDYPTELKCNIRVVQGNPEKVDPNCSMVYITLEEIVSSDNEYGFKGAQITGMIKPDKNGKLRVFFFSDMK
ncbi:hypothetical protein DRJ17_04680 [Candidatus Woesearchaeota archaeon]|nr:MAG: hypothetical protein DRJ17_04680 [Candidatus Woesearchaeota archaeon]